MKSPSDDADCARREQLDVIEVVRYFLHQLRIATSHGCREAPVVVHGQCLVDGIYYLLAGADWPVAWDYVHLRTGLAVFVGVRDGRPSQNLSVSPAMMICVPSAM